MCFEFLGFSPRNDLSKAKLLHESNSIFIWSLELGDDACDVLALYDRGLDVEEFQIERV